MKKRRDNDRERIEGTAHDKGKEREGENQSEMVMDLAIAVRGDIK